MKRMKDGAQAVRIEITGTGSELQGVGRMPDGRAVFVPGALPCETVEAEIVRDAARFCEARLLRVLVPSTERASSACPHYGRCGGCGARHMSYEYSLRLKRQRVFDALERLGGVAQPQVYETIGCVHPDRCRNKAEYVVDCRSGCAVMGCYEDRSHRILPLEDCLLQRPESICALNWVRMHLTEYDCAAHIKGLVTRVNREGAMMVAFCGDAPVQDGLRGAAAAMMGDIKSLESVFFCRLKARPAHALDGACTHIAGARTLSDRLFDLYFDLSPQSFFQVNPEQAEVLYQRALDAAEAGPEKRLLDAYCGAGTITLAAARCGAKVLGVEIVPPAIENAQQNARRNGLASAARFVCADAAREIPRRIAAGERFDSAILDPPRKGADVALLNALADAAIPRIAYVSCNPSTLARDVKLLSARGYRLKWAQPVDMFPWTAHVETVAALTLENTAF